MYQFLIDTFIKVKDKKPKLCFVDHVAMVID
jgi:hypothetical protein